MQHFLIFWQKSRTDRKKRCLPPQLLISRILRQFPMDCLFSIGFSWYYVYKNPSCVQSWKSWLILVIWSQGKIRGTDIPGPRLSDYLYARICSEACFYLFDFRVEQQKNSCLMEMNDVRSAVEELNMEKVSNKCTTCLLSITTVLNLLC